MLIAPFFALGYRGLIHGFWFSVSLSYYLWLGYLSTAFGTHLLFSFHFSFVQKNPFQYSWCAEMQISCFVVRAVVLGASGTFANERWWPWWARQGCWLHSCNQSIYGWTFLGFMTAVGMMMAMLASKHLWWLHSTGRKVLLLQHIIRLPILLPSY